MTLSPCSRGGSFVVVALIRRTPVLKLPLGYGTGRPVSAVSLIRRRGTGEKGELIRVEPQRPTVPVAIWNSVWLGCRYSVLPWRPAPWGSLSIIQRDGVEMLQFRRLSGIYAPVVNP